MNNNHLKRQAERTSIDVADMINELIYEIEEKEEEIDMLIKRVEELETENYNLQK
jgi:hypothetical protein